MEGASLDEDKMEERICPSGQAQGDYKLRCGLVKRYVKRHVKRHA